MDFVSAPLSEICGVIDSSRRTSAVLRDPRIGVDHLAHVDQFNINWGLGLCARVMTSGPKSCRYDPVVNADEVLLSELQIHYFGVRIVGLVTSLSLHIAQWDPGCLLYTSDAADEMD